MSRIVATVCRSCPAGRDGLAGALRDALRQAGTEVELRETDCLSGCTRPSTVAFRAKGKTAYLFGDLTADDIPELLGFLALYARSPDGNFADARPLGALRGKAIARIPG
jgi:predicted metal-binding protein